MQGVWESGRVFWSGTMGRAEVRGNQQQQECSSGRQETGQDAGCSGRQALGGCGSGSLESCAQSNSSAKVEQAKKRPGSLYSFVTRPSTKRDRAGVAVPAAVLVLAVPPPKSHGAARQLTMGRRALHTFIMSRIISARHVYTQQPLHPQTQHRW